MNIARTVTTLGGHSSYILVVTIAVKYVLNLNIDIKNLEKLNTRKHHEQQN
jgi:hypothetical protein